MIDPILCELSGLGTLTPPDLMCRATVVVPARNEAAGLADTLDALHRQVTDRGARLGREVYEVIVLLNNCTDASSVVAEAYQAAHPDFRLHVAQCELAPEQAHVGTARRMLMDCACERLESLSRRDGRTRGILSTDADTHVAPDWVAMNLAELENGAEVVGGVIHLFQEELAGLDEGTRSAYLLDRAFQAQVARLESILDPDSADPWPRHLEHYGASLCCTPEVYRRSGGLPPVKPLEDVAFINALRRKGARIRHSPAVNVFTSARLNGRAEVGLSGQLRHWKQDAGAAMPHLVDSAEWLEHRFQTIAALRRLNEGNHFAPANFPCSWQDRIAKLRDSSLPTPEFLEYLDCDALIEEMFGERPDKPRRHGKIVEVMKRMDALILFHESSLTRVREDPA